MNNDRTWKNTSRNVINALVRLIGLGLLLFGLWVAVQTIQIVLELYQTPESIERFATAIERGSNIDKALGPIRKILTGNPNTGKVPPPLTKQQHTLAKLQQEIDRLYQTSQFTMEKQKKLLQENAIQPKQLLNFDIDDYKQRLKAESSYKQLLNQENKSIRFSYFFAWGIVLLLLLLTGSLSLSAIKIGGQLALYDSQIKQFAQELIRTYSKK